MVSSDHVDAWGKETSIAISSTFTAEPLQQPLNFWMQELQVPARISFAPYNQVFQQLLDPSSVLSTNQNGVNVVLVRFEDWYQEVPDPDGAGLFFRMIEQNTRYFVRALIKAVERTAIYHFICVCPASPVMLGDPQGQRFFEKMEDLIIAGLSNITSAHVISSAELASVYPVAQYYDPYADKLARMPFTPLFFAGLGTMIGRKIYALKSFPYKAIVLDCDQTLWGGVCGEDGALGIQIDPVRRAVQEFVVRQHDAGMLLCLCSKNNEEDVWEVFERRSDMALSRDHIVSSRINWRAKSENIKSLAQELNLGLDSFIFMDDDPVECAEVQSNCPEVLTIQLPQDTATIPRFLSHIWAFDHLQVTEEAKGRTALYQQNSEREHFRKKALSFEEFLGSLGLKIEFSPLAPHQAERVSELTQRTNQFNFTGIRRSEAEIRQLHTREGRECLIVQVRDRFGDYGLVGVIIFKVDNEVLRVDTFLLSCRALGRGVEHQMLSHLGKIAGQRGLSHIDIRYVKSGKNRLAINFLEAVGENFKEPFDGGFLFRLSAECAAQVSYSPKGRDERREASIGGPAPTTTTSRAGTTLDMRAKSALLSSIAMELYSAEGVQKVLAGQNPTASVSKSQFVAPRSRVEEEIAEIWSEILGIERVGVHDNFFELGGHSLLAIEVLSRMREAFRVELSPRLLFNGEFTVAGLAKTALQEEVLQADPQQIAKALRRVEQLSDEEVKTMLGIRHESE